MTFLINKVVKTLFLTSLLLSLTSYADSLEFPRGLWEGIYENDFHYNVLEIKDTGVHILHRLFLASDTVEQYEFTDRDIMCNRETCKIRIALPAQNTAIELTASTVLGARKIHIIETLFDVEETATNSYQYTLHAKSGKSTIRELMEGLGSPPGDRHDDEESLLGFWFGIINIDGRDGPDLVFIDINAKEPSRFSVYQLGQWGKYQATFNLDENNKLGNADVINARYRSLTTTLVLHRNAVNGLWGNVFTYDGDEPSWIGSLVVSRWLNTF